MIRLCPSSSTSTTVVSPASAPIAITFAAQSTPTLAERRGQGGRVVVVVPSGCSGPSWLYGTIPVSTMVTSTYSTVTMASEPKMPRGRSRPGVLGLLRRGGDHVESDEREEHQRRRREHAEDAEATTARRRRSAAAAAVPGPIWCRPADGSLGGMNGERLLALK